MELLRFIPVRLMLLLVAGILIGKYLDPTPVFALLFTLLSIITWGLVFAHTSVEHSYSFICSASVSVIGMGMLSYAFTLPENHPGHYLNHNFSGTKILKVEVREVLKPTRNSNRYKVALQQMDSTEVSGSLLMLVPLNEYGSDFRVDHVLQVRARLESPLPALNPHQFDYKAYLKNQGIYHQFRPEWNKICLLDSVVHTKIGYAARVRNNIIARFAGTDFKERELAVFQALLLGQRNELHETTYDNYKDAGAIHILAVSGLHIGILLWFLHFLFQPLERIARGRSLKLVLLLLILWCYALLTGMSPPIIRSVSMFSFVAYALYLNRPSNTFNIVALSMFLILLVYDARLLFQAGFQMSYSAVLAIVWIYPKLQKLYDPRSWLFKKVWQFVSVSLAAQMGILPVSLYYFHQFPGLFIITNLLIVPFLGIILGLGFTSVLLAVIGYLPDLLIKSYEKLLFALNELIVWIAAQRAFVFDDIPFDLTRLCCLYLVLAGVALSLSKLSCKRLLPLLTGIIALQLWSTARLLLTKREEKVWIMHQWANTLLLHQQGTGLVVASSKVSAPEKLVSSIRRGEGLDHTTEATLKQAYRWGNCNLLIVDEKGLLPPSPKQIHYLLLINSPRIHLERVLDAIKPSLVIADGSNYRSITDRWKASCEKMEIAFHNTADDGAFVLEVD